MLWFRSWAGLGLVLKVYTSNSPSGSKCPSLILTLKPLRTAASTSPALNRPALMAEPTCEDMNLPQLMSVPARKMSAAAASGLASR